jgi:hypothetical protein
LQRVGGAFELLGARMAVSAVSDGERRKFQHRFIPDCPTYSLA